MTLPARKEGIIPGAANLRLARYVGDRVARQAILAELRIDCASPEGRLICDYIAAPDAMDFEVTRLVNHVTGSGMVSAAGNRRALRIAEEPLDQFRRYMSVYAREQAHCHFSPALIANLEKFWNLRQKEIPHDLDLIVVHQRRRVADAGKLHHFRLRPALRHLLAPVSRVSRSDCAPRSTSVGQLMASHTAPQLDIALPACVARNGSASFGS